MSGPRPNTTGIVRELAQRAELPMPRVYVMHNPQPNAFATGRNPRNAAVCASTGLLEMLSREEVAGVMAHELAHIKNRDTLTMTVAATIGGAISMLAQYLQFGMLFGGNATRRQPDRRLRRHAARADRGHAGADGDQPLARVSGGPHGRADLRATHVAGLGAQKIQGYAHQIPNDTAEARRRPRTCSSSTRCPASAWTTCSRPTPTPRTASPSWRSWLRSWVPAPGVRLKAF